MSVPGRGRREEDEGAYDRRSKCRFPEPHINEA